MTKLSDFKTQDKNANKHTGGGMSSLGKSMDENGWITAMTATADNEVFDGSARLEKASEKFGDVEPIVVDIDGTRPVILRRTDIENARDPRAVRAGIAANRVAELNLEWDAEVLGSILEQDAEMLDGLFNDDELLEMGLIDEPIPADAEPEIDRAEELREKWGVETGQLWHIGEHRLICGDCTDAAVVERVMGGERADMVFTDPPYGVDYEGGANNEKKREKLEGDDSGDLYLPALKMYKKFSVKTAPMYVWFAASVGKPVYDAVDAVGYDVRAMIIWNKIDPHYGAFMAQYMQKHEPCLYIVNGNANFKGASNEVTVWDIKQPSRNEHHPTQKPIELALRAIGNHNAEIVSDYFLGSGTTMLACQNLNRKCRAVEISPAYVAVALERMATAFPELEIYKAE